MRLRAAGLDRLVIVKPFIEYFVVRRVGRNRGIIAAHGAWPRNIIVHRGWGDSVARRKMTPEEIEDEKRRTRFHSVTYKGNLESLLEDERRCLLPDHKDIYDELEKDLRRSPQIRLYETDPKPDPQPGPADSDDDMAAG